MTSKKWYWLAVGLLLAGIAGGVAGCRAVIARVESLHRVVMPGKVEVTLPAGDITLYTEQRSIVDGKVYEITGDFQFRCAVADPAGKPLPLQKPTSSTRYSFGDHAGRNTFDLHADTAGTYVLACESPKPFVIAIGSGIGTAIVICVLSGLIPVLLGVVTFILVIARRGKQRRAARFSQARSM
jgi:hypothetical protein